MKNSTFVHERVDFYAKKEIETLIKDFDLKSSGLTDKQVALNHKKYGKNLFAKNKSDSTLFRLRRAFINPFTLILFVLASISFLTYIFSPSLFSENIATFPIIMTMLILSGIIRFIEEMKAKKVSDFLTNLVHSDVLVKRNGFWIKINPSKVVIGDLVRFSAGEKICADIRLTKTNNLFISQSVLSGESEVLEKNNKKLEHTKKDFKSYKNTVFMGSSIISGNGEGIVLAIGKDTVYGSFLHDQKEKKNTFYKGASSISLVLIKFMAVLTPLVFVACFLTKGDFLLSFFFSLSVAIGLTPEMLPMIINACLARGSAVMGKKQTIVKNINAMQSFGSMDTLLVDKTKTLTGDNIILEYYMDILGNESKICLDFSYLNSLYQNVVQNHLDKAILKCENMQNQKSYYKALSNYHTKLTEIPFDHERKIASVLVKGNHHNILIVKGSVDEIFNRCNYFEYRNKINAIEKNNIFDIHAVIDDMLEDGMKVLSVAYKIIDEDKVFVDYDDENDLILLGFLAFFDAPKKDASDAIKKLKSLNVNIKVLTGDEKDTTISVCKRLNIDTFCCLTGDELDSAFAIKLAL